MRPPMKRSISGRIAELENIHDAPAVTFETLADIAVDTGHSGWIQPQWLVVTVEGLRAYTGKRLTVFLHCYSPDGVDRAYHVMANENLLAGRFWRVPAGFEGRFDPGGILAWDVPADIVDQDRVNLLISPLRKPWHMIHHWVRDGGFASILNDVWVVQRGDGSQ
jgi:hypothetical protein